MIDKQNFEKIKKILDEYDAKREEIVRKSRDIVKLSKQIIYSIHRRDIKRALELERDIKKELKNLHKLAESPKHLYEGSVKIAVMEFVEAIAYLEFVRNEKIIPFTEDYIDIDYYLMGLCDLIGELTRNAINSIIEGDYKTVETTREVVKNIYWWFVQLDLRDNELRRKVDAIKWELKKLDEVCCELKLKEIKK